MSTQLGNITVAYVLPRYDWTKLVVLPHFILWGRISCDEKTLAHLAITERHKVHTNSQVWDNRVWENQLVPYHDRLDVQGHNQAKRIVEKFERLWPCTFLAREYHRTTGG